MFRKILELMKNYPEISIKIIDIDKEPEYLDKYEVFVTPAIIFPNKTIIFGTGRTEKIRVFLDMLINSLKTKPKFFTPCPLLSFEGNTPSCLLEFDDMDVILMEVTPSEGLMDISFDNVCFNTLFVDENNNMVCLSKKKVIEIANKKLSYKAYSAALEDANKMGIINAKEKCSPCLYKLIVNNYLDE